MNKIQRTCLLVAGTSAISLALWKTFTTPDSAHPPSISTSFVQQLPFPVVFGLGALIGLGVGASLGRYRRNTGDNRSLSNAKAPLALREQEHPPVIQKPATAPVRVSILTDNLKHPLLQDPEALRIFALNNIEINVTALPDVHAHPTQDEYDILWPTNAPPPPTDPAAKIRKLTPFLYSTLGLATWQPICDTLSRQAIYQKPTHSAGSLDLNMLVNLLARQTTWAELYGPPNISGKAAKVEIASQIHPSVLPLLLAHAAKTITQQTKTLLATSGLSLSDCLLSVDRLQNPYLDPFEDYINLGQAHSPMVIAYEHQYRYAYNEGRFKNSTYFPRFVPFNQAILIQHPLLSSSPAGDSFAALVSTSSELGFLFSNHYGYRTPSMRPTQSGFNTLVSISDAPSLSLIQRCQTRVQELLSQPTQHPRTVRTPSSTNPASQCLHPHG